MQESLKLDRLGGGRVCDVEIRTELVLGESDDVCERERLVVHGLDVIGQRER
jgi:hypothetical protein